MHSEQPINSPQEIVAHSDERLGRRVVLPRIANNGFNKSVDLRRDLIELDPILLEILRKVKRQALLNNGTHLELIQHLRKDVANISNRRVVGEIIRRHSLPRGIQSVPDPIVRRCWLWAAY